MSAAAKVEVLQNEDTTPALMPVAGRAITPMDLLNRVIETGAGVEVIEKFMALQERWEANQARKAFEAAVAAAKAEIPVIKKNRHVGFESKRTDSRTDYWHEDMGEIARTIDPILGKNGLNYRYRSKQEGVLLTVTCILAHTAGHFEETSLTAGNDMTGNKNSHQGVGSAATYLQRYTLKLALGLSAAKDDDAKAAGLGETITDEQVDELTKLLTDTKSNIVLFLKTIKLESLTEIGTDKFESVKKLIVDTAAKRAEREKGAQS